MRLFLKYFFYHYFSYVVNLNISQFLVQRLLKMRTLNPEAIENNNFHSGAGLFFFMKYSIIIRRLNMKIIFPRCSDEKKWRVQNSYNFLIIYGRLNVYDWYNEKLWIIRIWTNGTMHTNRTGKKIQNHAVSCVCVCVCV